MGENLYQQHGRPGTNLQNLQRMTGIKHQGSKTSNQLSRRKEERQMANN